MCYSSHRSIPVVFAFTPNYIVPAATCVLSIFNEAEPGDTFHFICLLTTDLSEAHRKMFSEVVHAHQSSLTFVNLENYKLDTLYINPKYTVAASYRLLLPELLPDYDKVLYLDCDIIVQNNIAELYRNVDVSECYMAGVFEATLDIQLPHMKEIGCHPGSYINSGLLLMNLKALREDRMVGKFLAAASADHLEFPDQDVINQLCKGKIRGLAPHWNSIRTFLLPQYKSDFLKYYSLSAWERVQSHGNIHFTGPKPWHTFTVGFGTWWHYFYALPPSIQKLAAISPGLYALARLYQTSCGKWCIDLLQKTYRVWKGKKYG